MHWLLAATAGVPGHHRLVQILALHALRLLDLLVVLPQQHLSSIEASGTCRWQCHTLAAGKGLGEPLGSEGWVLSHTILANQPEIIVQDNINKVVFIKQ